nr:hypothetical protein [Mahella sp.]
MFKKAHDAGKYVAIHSCGDIHELFPDLIEIGLDVYNTSSRKQGTIRPGPACISLSFVYVLIILYII